jgi:hypothetical protein
VRAARHRIPRLGIFTVTGVVSLVMTALPAAAAPVPPDQYADAACSEVVDWADGLNAASQDFDAADTPSEAAEALEGAVDGTTTLIKQLRKAGTPDVDGGKASARAFIAPFKDGRKALAQATDDAADLRAGDGFDDAKTEIDDSLDEAFTALGPDIDAVQADADAELQEALEADSSCAEVFGNEAASDEP